MDAYEVFTEANDENPMSNMKPNLPKFLDIQDKLLTLMENKFREDLTKYQTAYIIFENLESIIYRYENNYTVNQTHLKALGDLCRMWCIFACEEKLIKELETVCENIRFNR